MANSLMCVILFALPDLILGWYVASTMKTKASKILAFIFFSVFFFLFWWLLINA